MYGSASMINQSSQQQATVLTKQALIRDCLVKEIGCDYLVNKVLKKQKIFFLRNRWRLKQTYNESEYLIS